MPVSQDQLFRENLHALAENFDRVHAQCRNEESTKHFLVLPMFRALGYDTADPSFVQPEYLADFRDSAMDRVDYVLFAQQRAAIAVECKSLGTALEAHRGQLRQYFAAINTVSLGLLTDGRRFEFFVDADRPNIMDEEPFLEFDIDELRSDRRPNALSEVLALFTPDRFDIRAIVAHAEQALLERRLRSVAVREIRQPSEDFCRHMLGLIGVKNIRDHAIRSRYADMVKDAFTEAFVLPVVELLRARAAPDRPQLVEGSSSDAVSRIITTDRERAVFQYVCRRLAYHARSEHEFAAVEDVAHRDYIGKFAVYYKQVQKGRLFSFIEGQSGYDTYIFPDPIGKIVTNSLADIDHALAAVFFQRVQELSDITFADLQSA